jgi:hypothetical protein
VAHPWNYTADHLKMGGLMIDDIELRPLPSFANF